MLLHAPEPDLADLALSTEKRLDMAKRVTMEIGGSLEGWNARRTSD